MNVEVKTCHPIIQCFLLDRRVESVLYVVVSASSHALYQAHFYPGILGVTVGT